MQPHTAMQRSRRPGKGGGLVVTLMLATTLLAGCAKVGNLFGKDDNSTPPSPLPALEAPVEVATLWSHNPTGGARSLHLNLVPAISEERVFVAGFRGELSALERQSGDEVWSQKTDLAISGGPGFGEGLVVVGTEEAEVAAYNAADGSLAWKSRVSSEVLAPPRISGGIVIVRTVDGKLFGLRAADGGVQWLYDRTVPALSLRGTSAPVISDGLAVVGFDSGRLVAIDIAEGVARWETRVAVGSGRTELQRIVDVDAEPVIADGILYAVTFQGRVIAVDTRSGDTIWRRDMSSHSGLAVDNRRLVITDDEGVVWALSRDTSASLWRQEKLKGRQLGAPAVVDNYLLVGDFEGYVHWIEMTTGEILGRVQVGNEPISVRPVVLDGVAYVLGDGGTLSAITRP